tara:strand:+ start:1156 stop:1323 length:168 start_codon:yes stop_codon:yes gene_type:complete
MLTFEDWYESNYPDIDPVADDFYEQLKKCYEDGWDACADAHDGFTYDEISCHEND